MLNFKQIFRFIIQDFKSQKKLHAFFIFNLILGFLGFLFLQIFQASLSYQTEQKAQEILGGDLVISGRRLITEDEIKKIEQDISLKFKVKAKTNEFFAMVKAGDQARLTFVKSVSQNYPIYGDLTVKKNNLVLKADQITDQTLYVDSEVIDQLKLEKSSDDMNLQIGDLNLKITAQIQDDPSRSFRFGALAPFILISESNLAKTNLIKPGSTVTTSYYYSLINPEQANFFKEQLEKKILDTTLRFSSAQSEEDTSNRLFKYLNDYLGLVALISLGLCFLCLSYMLNWFFHIQKKDIAIFKVLGVHPTSILKLQITKNIILSVFSFSIALLFLFICKPGLQILVDQYLEINLKIIFNLNSLFASFIIVLVGPQLIAIPTYLVSMNLNPLLLLRHEISLNQILNLKIRISWAVGLIFVFWLVAVWQSHSFSTASLFIVGLLVSVLFSLLFIYLILIFLDRILNSFSFLNRYAYIALIRKPGTTYLIFITMSLALVVLTLLPQIKNSIINEVRPSDNQKIPSVFMFDIQPDQTSKLSAIIKNDFLKDIQLTPLVRSRILKINNKDYERDSASNLFTTREDENEARFRNRGVNLTYKALLQESETLVEGKWFGLSQSKNWRDPSISEVSLEEKYAEKVSAKLGDILTFDVQGLEIKGQVTSTRRVRWTSFQPNFFIVFQPEVLEAAPQIFLTSLSGLSENQVKELQYRLVDQFPNISIINVKQSVEKSLVFIDQMALALQVMAGLALIVGFFIFIILINTQVRERLIELNLLHVLGLNKNSIKKILLKQFSVLIFMSLFSGISLGLSLSYLLIEFIFDLTFKVDLYSIFGLVALISLITYLVTLLAVKPFQRLNPLDLLKTQDGFSN